MDEKKAREILEDSIEPQDSLFELSWYLEWLSTENYATLDGKFDAEDLEAIAWWMRNKKEKGERNGKQTTSE